MGNEWDSVPHPKSQRDAFLETAHLEKEADNAFNTKSAGDKAASVNKIRQELEGMTPVERMVVARNLKTVADSVSDVGSKSTPTADTAAVPMAKMELDPNGDIKSLSFKSVSSDKHFGETIKIDLDHKRTDNGPNTREFKLPDGETRVVQMDSTGKQVIGVQDSSGTSFERSGDGESWVRNGSDASRDTVKDLKVNADGSVSYKMGGDVPAPFGSLEMTERMLANGDRSLTSKITGDDGKSHDVEMLIHQEYPSDGKTDSIMRTTARIADLGKERIDTVTRMKDGETITESPGSRISVSADANKYTIQNRDENGQIEPGVVTATRVLDALGKFASGTLEVTFPDGMSKKFDDMQESEWKLTTGGSGQRIKWITKDGDPDHFTITVMPSDQ